MEHINRSASRPNLRTHDQGTYTFASLDLQRGGQFGPITQAYETWGKLNAARDNAVLVAPTLTADTFVHDEEEPNAVYKAWWNFVIGPGRPIDPTRFFVICPNVLGGCYGSTGPSSLDPATQRPYGMSFPVITVRDIVNAQKQLIESFGITSLNMVIGGSFGGVQALEWAVTYPECVQKVVVAQATGASSARAIAWNEIGRQVVKMDPRWQDGDYTPGEGPRSGLAIARMLAITTYSSEGIMEKRFGRTIATNTTVPTPSGTKDLGGRFDVESYLYFVGGSFSYDFDPNSYLYISRAGDLYDVSEGYPSLEASLSRIQSKALFIGGSSDVLIPAEHVRLLAEKARACGVDAHYQELDSPLGHEAFLREQKQMQQVLWSFLEA